MTFADHYANGNPHRSSPRNALAVLRELHVGNELDENGRLVVTTDDSFPIDDGVARRWNVVRAISVLSAMRFERFRPCKYLIDWALESLGVFPRKVEAK